jgi:hypothetical protein
MAADQGISEVCGGDDKPGYGSLVSGLSACTSMRHRAPPRSSMQFRIAGLEIINAKGATYYGIGSALVRIVRAILQDEQAVLTVSNLVPQSMELGELFFSLAAIINRDGVARVLSTPLNRSEQKALETSAKAVKQYVAALDSLSLSPREMLKGV